MVVGCIRKSTGFTTHLARARDNASPARASSHHHSYIALPDGRIYEPEKIALVEDKAAQLQSADLQTTDTAKILTAKDTQVAVQTDAASPAFLVLSDVNYPGWQAWIDGKSTRIFQTNYVQRGVNIPAGKHFVRFEFHPFSFKLGAGITVASLFGCLYWLRRMQ